MRTHFRLPLLLAAAALTTASSAFASNVTWDIAPGTVGTGDSAITGGAGTWDNALGNWTTDTGATNVAWDNTLNATDTAVFGGAAVGTVTINQATNLGGLKFTLGGSTGYNLAGTGSLDFGSALGTIDTSTLPNLTNNNTTLAVALTGTGGLTIAANGNTGASGGSSNSRFIISGTNTGLTGGIAITGGLVNFTNSSAAGSAATTAGSGNTLTLSNGGGLYNTVATTLGNNIVLSTGGGTIRTANSVTLTLNGVVSGSGTLNKTDGATLILANNANSFTGAVNVQAGTLQLGNTNTSGTTFAFIGNALTLASGTTLALDNRFGTTTYNFANLSAPIAVQGATIAFSPSSSGNTTTKNFNAALDFSGTSAISYAAGAFTNTINLNRAVTGTGTLNITWTGGATARALNFASGQTNNYTGSVVLGNAAGAATVNLNSTLGVADWTINDADWNVRLSGTTHTFKSLSGSVGGTVGSVSGATTLAIGSGNTNTSFSGTLVNGGGTLALIKTGTGSLTLSGTNTHTGGTTINAGTLITGNASALGTGAVSIDGGTLTVGAAGLSGIASLTVNIGGLDTTAGILTTTGAFTLAGGTWTIGNTADGVAAGSFSITDALLDLAGFSNKSTAGSYSLIAGSGTSTLTNSNFVNGDAGFTYALDANGDLVVTAVPEPSTYGLLGAGALATVAFVRRRRKSAGKVVA